MRGGREESITQTRRVAGSILDEVEVRPEAVPMWVPKRRKRAPGTTNTRHGRLRREYCARLEVLEDRQLLAGTLITVNDPSYAYQANPGTPDATSTDIVPSGVPQITLYSAIAAAEAPGASGPVTIKFSGSMSIATDPNALAGQSPWGTITVPLTISAGSYTVVLGADYPNGTFGVYGLVFANLGPNVVQGLTIKNFSGGILLSGPANTTSTSTGNMITDCTITNSIDDLAFGAATGLVLNNCVANTISGNVIASNAAAGIDISGGNTNVISGNTVQGNGVEYLSEFGGSGAGVNITNSAQNSILQNSFYSNQGDGIDITGKGTNSPTDSSGNIIQFNFIGTNGNQSTGLGNYYNGITLTGAYGTTIGATGAAGGTNVISGNGGDGVHIGAHSPHTVVQYNWIGENDTGTAALPNDGNGISVGSPDFTIAFNQIAGNKQNGIYVAVGATETNRMNNLIQSNTIGVSPSGVPIPNQNDGIEVYQSSYILIGGTDATGNAGNLIQHSGGFGVDIEGSGSNDNSILNNAMSHNASKGIFLAIGTNITPGATFSIPAPVLTRATDGSGLISGTLTAVPGTYTIQYFTSPDTGGTDAAGDWEGEVYQGQTTLTIPGSGSALVQANLTLPNITLPADSHLSATATDSVGDTSQFCDNAVPTGSNPLQVVMLTLVPNPNPPVAGQAFNFTVTATAPAGMPTPGGQVGISESSTPGVGTGGALLADGTFTNGWPTTESAGQHTYTVSYVPDTGSPYSPATMDFTITVAPATQAPTLVLKATANANQTVTLTLTATGPAGTPTGDISFNDADDPLFGGTATLTAAGTNSSSAVFTTPPLTAGQHTFGAFYAPAAGSPYGPGPSNNVPVTVAGSTTLEITPASTSPRVADQDLITVKATTPGGSTPMGKIAFTLTSTAPGSKSIAPQTATLNNGLAYVNLFGVPVGSYTLQAAYTGDSPAAMATQSLTVRAAVVAVELVAQPLVGKNAILNVTVSCPGTVSSNPTAPTLGSGHLPPFTGTIDLTAGGNVDLKTKSLAINNADLPKTSAVDCMVKVAGSDDITAAVKTSDPNFASPMVPTTIPVKFEPPPVTVTAIIALSGTVAVIDFSEPIKRQSADNKSYYTVVLLRGDETIPFTVIPSAQVVKLKLHKSIKGQAKIAVKGTFESTSGTQTPIDDYFEIVTFP